MTRFTYWTTPVVALFQDLDVLERKLRSTGEKSSPRLSKALVRQSVNCHNHGYHQTSRLMIYYDYTIV